MKFAGIVLTIGLVCSSAPAYAQSQGQWSKVERLTPGGIIVVRDDSGAAVRGRVLRADAESILIYAPKVDVVQLKPIERMARDRPALLGRVDMVTLELPDSDLRISSDGISKNGSRVASFEDFFHVAPRASVISVIQPKDQRGSLLTTVAGIAIGAGAGWASGVVIALADDGHCSPHCAVRNIEVGAAFVSGPILGGKIGNALGKSHTDLIIYRR